MKKFQLYSLKPYNTFKLESIADQYIRIEKESEFIPVLKELAAGGLRFLVLGGGSNILFTGDYHGTVIHVATRGIELTGKRDDHVFIKVSAGENWDDFVAFCLKSGWYGLENLSGIPGQAGSSPIQNIGAYGVELKDLVHEVEAIDTISFSTRRFTRDECSFGYRDSIFKKGPGKHFIILNVTFRLELKADLKLGYYALREELGNVRPGDLDPLLVRDAVISIRSRKLPDPEKIGNAGSFFKNPLIEEDKLRMIQLDHPEVPFFPADEGKIKIAAGWLIEKCGWKGYRVGDAGVYDKQALVLVNYGKATGEQIVQLSDDIRRSVMQRFAILLEPEVNFL